VCRAKDNLQEEFDFMKSEFELLKHCEEYIFISDIGQNCRNVTNDAENVVKRLYLEYEITDKTRIFYEDSYGRVDEILHSGETFKGFKAGHEGVDLGDAA
jgi:hypothetical protein